MSTIEILRGGTKAIKDFIELLFKKLRQLVDDGVGKAVVISENIKSLTGKIGAVAKVIGGKIRVFYKGRVLKSGNTADVEKFLGDLLKLGSGGSYRTLKVISRKMYGQEWRMSCTAACIKQLAKDFGIDLQEKAIRNLLKTDELTGTNIANINAALKKVFTDKSTSSGMFILKEGQTYSGGVEFLTKEYGSWIATIGRPGHSVIVDAVVDGKVKIRDPWPLNGKIGDAGVEGYLDMDEFVDLWKQGSTNLNVIK